MTAAVDGVSRRIVSATTVVLSAAVLSSSDMVIVWGRMMSGVPYHFGTTRDASLIAALAPALGGWRSRESRPPGKESRHAD